MTVQAGLRSVSKLDMPGWNAAATAAVNGRRPSQAPSPALALASLAEIEFRMGHWAAAHATAVEALGLAHSSLNSDATMHALARLALVEAGLGREAACRHHAEQASALAARHGSERCLIFSHAALGLLELALTRFDAAIALLAPLTWHAGPQTARLAADLAEALIRRGDRERAAHTVATLASQPRSLTVGRSLARCRGLLAPENEFEAHFARALDVPVGLEEPFERARTELCFGQRLRRAGWRIAARERLDFALATFERLGAVHWSATTRRELGASGTHARKRLDETRDELTSQECQVASLVAEGATNREAASQLFVSPKTIETHLSSIYRKLGVRSRTELARISLDDDATRASIPARSDEYRDSPDASPPRGREGCR